MNPAALAHYKSTDYTDHPPRRGHHVELDDGIARDAGGGLVRVGGFDYDAVDRALGFKEPITPRDKAFTDAADLLEVLAVWISESNSITSAGRRALALAYALRPGSFPDRSTGALALRMGTTRQSLLKYVSQVYQLSHGLFISRTMRPKAYRERQSKNSLAYHRRKSHTLHAKE